MPLGHTVRIKPQLVHEFNRFGKAGLSFDITKKKRIDNIDIFDEVNKRKETFFTDLFDLNNISSLQIILTYWYTMYITCVYHQIRKGYDILHQICQFIQVCAQHMNFYYIKHLTLCLQFCGKIRSGQISCIQFLW